MSAIEIRLATAQDLPFIKSCAVAAYQHYIPRIGKPPAPMVADFAAQLEHIHLIVADSEPRGFAVFFPRGDHMFLENIAIHPSGQGQGLGVKLIDFIEAQARDASLAAIELYSNEMMVENLSYYPKLGFVETDRRTEDGFNRVYFRKGI